MNIKLIVGSILGISSLGGAAGYYFLKPENTTKNKDNTNSETKSSESLGTTETTIPDLQTQPNSKPDNLKPAELPPAPREEGSGSRPTTVAGPEVRGSENTGSRVGDSSLSRSFSTEDVQRAVET